MSEDKSPSPQEPDRISPLASPLLWIPVLIVAFTVFLSLI